MKICNECDRNKDLDKFGKDSSKKDGLRSTCKDCRNLKRRNGRPARPNNMAKDGLKRCCTCKKVHKLKFFYKCKTTKDGYRPDCTECGAKKCKEYYNTHPEKFEDTKRKKLMLVTDLEPGWRIRVKKFYNWTCLKCNSNRNIEVDHVIPLSLGGAHKANNLQTLCKKCNRSKSNRNNDDFRNGKIYLGI